MHERCRRHKEKIVYKRLPRLIIVLIIVLCAIIGSLPIGGQLSAAPLAQPDPPRPPVAPFSILDAWASSAHADSSAPSFTLWNEASPPRIPAECAKCHSGTGFQDALGADGSTPDQVDGTHPIGGVIACKTCHNDVTLTKDSVVTASGAELTGLGRTSLCVECHLGNGSKSAIDAAIKDAGVDLDTVSQALSFDGYHADAGVLISFGTMAQGGYEYDGQHYDTIATHVQGYEGCVDCHNSHSLALNLRACAECHQGIATIEDLRNIRMDGSRRDYNGNGDIAEGIYYELAGLREKLLSVIQRYAKEIAGSSIAYNVSSPPYFFVDTNDNSIAEPGEVHPVNRYTNWTPRLLQAAYNFHSAEKNSSAYVHGNKYVIQLLYDSIASLNEALAEPEDISALHRNDAGHFAGSQRAFRYWDERGAVPGACAKCHTASGMAFFLKESVNVLTPPSNGLQCTTCHDSLTEYTFHITGPVRFPSGTLIDSGNPGVNLCLNCHQGRESTAGVDRIIGDATPDEQAAGLRFPDLHFFAASSTHWGSEVQGAYEYRGKTYGEKEYTGFFAHGAGQLDLCNDCHDIHSLEVKIESCMTCHIEVRANGDVRTIRATHIDFDGDGDDKEGIYYEIATLQEKLYSAIQRYARNVVGQPIAYQPNGYPYFFVIDRNGDGEANSVESKPSNAYKPWTPRLLRAAYNYQNSLADPGAFSHNAMYIIQSLYDSIEDLGDDVSTLTRP